jgi:hypothetical protein
VDEWCERCGEFFPEDEFDELDGVMYHRMQNGERHPADQEPVDEVSAG